MKRHINLQFTKNQFTGTASYWTLKGRQAGQLWSEENDADAQRIITLDGNDAPDWVYETLDMLLTDIPLADDQATWNAEQAATRTLSAILGVWHANKRITAKFAGPDLLANEVAEGDDVFWATKCGTVRVDAAPWL